MCHVYFTVRVIVLLITLIHILPLDKEAEMQTFTNHQDFEGLIERSGIWSLYLRIAVADYTSKFI